MKKINLTENILLAVLFIILPFFLGLSSNTGIMLWQLITFLLANIRLIRQVFAENKILKPGILEILLISVSVLSILHFFFSVNRYNCFLILVNILFISIFALFYLRYLSKDEFKKIQLFYLAGFFAQAVLAIIQFILKPGEPLKGGFLDPNYFAVYLIIGGLLIFGACLFNNVHSIYKTAGYLLTILIFFLIIATQSRSATGFFLLAATLMLFLKKPRYSLLGILVIVFLTLMPNPYKSKIKEVHQTDPYAYTRLKIYRMDIEIFADHFLLGAGLGCFADYSPSYNFPVEGMVGRYRVTPEQAHNSYLHWVVETGTTGFILMLMLLSIICRNVFHNLIRTAKTKGDDLHYNPGTDISILIIMAMGLLHNVFYNNSILILFFFLVFYSELFAKQITKKKTQFLKIQPSSQYGRKNLLAIVWLISFISIWYFFIHASWLSTVYFNRGIEELKKPDMKSSLQNFQKSLKIIPFYSKAWLYRADIGRFMFIKSSDMDYALSALKSYDRGLEYAERNGDLQMNRISMLINILDFIKSRNPKVIPADLEQEIDSGFARLFLTHPKKIFYYHDYAVYQWHNGHTSEARNALEHSLNIEPNYISAHILLSIIYEKIGDIESAEKHKTLAMKISAQNDYRQYANDFYLYNLLKWE